MANRGSGKESSLFAGLSRTETNLLVMANVCIKNGKVDYQQLAAYVGVKMSSAQTLFRNAKRKIDKMIASGNDAAEGNEGQGETPAKRRKSAVKAKKPRTPNKPKAAAPKASKSAKKVKSAKTATETETSEDEALHNSAPKPVNKRTAKAAIKSSVEGSASDAAATSDDAGVIIKPEVNNSEEEETENSMVEASPTAVETTELMDKARIEDHGEGKKGHFTGELDVQATEAALDWAVKQKRPSSPSISPSPAGEDA
ncbi:hypothetical protein N7457_003260 [Penicillium paradoxum]|uniref:uncharacterized protein n=1 Tax=Penicillium paradoxum TaxID=176176 RepID=UPI0025492D71|nr:uncharacterized protein N7457_003260 [Penicillium paradoxum]KAJ5788270.1 hypothetical protein N7457_003260 [Penicillium paradoxum]